MKDQQNLIQPSATDFEEASLEWSKIHRKTSEQMAYLTDGETAQCYLLAREFAQLRRRKGTQVKGQAGGPLND